jgi:hypothetical protein
MDVSVETPNRGWVESNRPDGCMELKSDDDHEL